jgi:hypothetical protein
MTVKPYRWRTVVVLLVPGLLLAFMFTPAIISAHRVRQERACENHLKTLYIGLCMYRQAHGKLPEKLSDLYPTFVRDLKVFECPSQGRKIRDATEINSLSGYVLCPPDLGEWGRSQNMKPLLCDRRCNHLFKWKTCWQGAILYEDYEAKGMPIIIWEFDQRSVIPTDYQQFLGATNRYDFPE